jgi:transposase
MLFCGIILAVSGLPSMNTTVSNNSSTTTSDTVDYAVQDLDHLGLVAGMVDELKIVETIDSLIIQDHNQRYISVGLAVKAMILNGLGFVQRVLYLMPMFFMNKPLERLLGRGITADQLNDDTLGRALDAIYKYGPGKLYSQLAAKAVKILGLNCKFGHLDSTSIHTDGVHNSDEEPQEGVIHITQGYSRDHRPDLNQVVLQLITENQAGIPIRLSALSGNSSDQTSFRETISNHIEQMKVDVGLQYVIADSALYSEATLSELGEFGWITRVPETTTVAREIIQSIAGELMAEAGEKEITYRALSTTYGGVRQRWLVVYTRSAHQRALKTLRKYHIKQSNIDLKAFSTLKRMEFACEADAQSALQAFTKKLTLTMIADAQIIERPHFSKKGRPGKDKKPVLVSYHIDGQLASRIDFHQQELQRKSSFIIATNELDEQALNHEEVIDLYKKGQQKVERGFRFLKDPLFMAAGLFLKSAKRIMALMMVMTLCLLVYSAIEYRIRKALQQEKKEFPDQLGKATQRPTARWVFQFFSGIRLLVVSKTQEIVLNINEHHHTLLSLLGERYVSLYENSA